MLVFRTVHMLKTRLNLPFIVSLGDIQLSSRMACHQSSCTQLDEIKPSIPFVPGQKLTFRLRDLPEFTQFDEAKLPIPYVPGQKLTVRPHDPPEPTQALYLGMEDLVENPIEKSSRTLLALSSIRWRIDWNDYCQSNNP